MLLGYDRAVMQPLQCAVQTAIQVCEGKQPGAASTSAAAASAVSSVAVAPPAFSLPSLSLYVATDTPAAFPWFETAVAELQYRYSSHFSSILIVRSEHGPPGHVGAFAAASDEQRAKAEQQLLADWYMLSRNDAVVTTGSILSFSAAALAGQIPIRAAACKPDW